MYALVDTNVFLDYLLKRDNGQAKNFFILSYLNKDKIFVSAMTLRDVEYTAHRTLHDKEKAKQIQIAVYQICQKVLGISADSAIESIYSNMSDYEDSLLVESAKEALLDCIVTNDKKDFKKCGIPIFSVEEMIDLYKKAPHTEI